MIRQTKKGWVVIVFDRIVGLFTCPLDASRALRDAYHGSMDMEITTT